MSSLLRTLSLRQLSHPPGRNFSRYFTRNHSKDYVWEWKSTLKVGGGEEGGGVGSKLIGGGWSLAVGAVKVEDFPSSGLRSRGLRPEVAFVGRSNVGKSSLINVILQQKIARTSKTPGRTQQINFFRRDPIEKHPYYIADLPGYGFAKAPIKVVEKWNVLLGAYVREREALGRVFTLIDSRRGLLETDVSFIDFLEGHRVPYQIVLTKIDKIQEDSLASMVESISSNLRSMRVRSCQSRLFAVSSRTGAGVECLRAEIAGILFKD
ncbi:hypothetical protein AAMO2058_000959300 [Amorphochlora amoebiformis]